MLRSLSENGFINARMRSSSEKSLKRLLKASCSNLSFSMYFAKLTIFSTLSNPFFLTER